MLDPNEEFHKLLLSLVVPLPFPGLSWVPLVMTKPITFIDNKVDDFILSNEIPKIEVV